MINLTKKHLIEKDHYNKIVHDKWNDKDLFVDPITPPFGEYSGDLLDGGKKYLGDISDKTVLDLACGNGEISVWLAKNGADVYGVDISDECIKVCQKRSEVNGVSNRTHFFVAPSESTGFADNFFDAIYINVALHHFEIDQALKEFLRILKPGGMLVAVEPLAFSKIIQKIRESKLVTKFYPVFKETPTERILLQDDLDLIKKYFGNIQYRPFRIFNPFIFKISPLFNFLSDCFYRKEKNIEMRKRKFNRSMQRLDENILTAIPFAKYLSRYVVFKSVKADK